MSIKRAVLAVLAAENYGQPSAYGVLDNKLYLLAQLSGEDFGYQVELHGPRSSSVSAEIGALVEAGFVEERSSCAVGDGPSPALVRSYVLTDEARTVLPSVRQRLEPYAAYVARL